MAHLLRILAFLLEDVGSGSASYIMTQNLLPHVPGDLVPLGTRHHCGPQTHTSKTLIQIKGFLLFFKFPLVIVQYLHQPETRTLSWNAWEHQWCPGSSQTNVIYQCLTFPGTQDRHRREWCFIYDTSAKGNDTYIWHHRCYGPAQPRHAQTRPELVKSQERRERPPALWLHCLPILLPPSHLLNAHT